MSRRLLSLIAVATALPLLATGCATSDAGSAGSASAANAVRIDVTDDGCAPVPDTVTAGALTFAVTNQDATRVTEAEVMQDGRILAEKENLTPGLSGQFSLRLEAGEYVVYCPNATQDRSTLTVQAAGGAGSASAPTDATLTAAVTAYRAFLQNRADALLSATRAFAAAVKAGDIAKAKRLYAPARANYEAIEPVAESFGELDPEIDARAGDVEPTAWAGFHRIEKALWQDKSLAGMDRYADKLVADVGKLVEAIPSAQLQAASIANGAVDLLGEVANSKITGEEDRYSHTDLWDFEANVAGVREAIDVLSPVLRQRDPELLATANTQFAAVLDALSTYKTAEGYVDYSTVGRPERRVLTTLVNTLAETLSKVAPAIV